jgi:hypothetical protein
VPALSYPDQATAIDLWDVRERGVRGSGTSSPEESLEIDSAGATRTFRVKWDKRKDFAKYMLGYGVTWDDSGTRRLSRLLPRAHPDYPDLVATKVTRIVGHKWTGVAVNSVTAGYAADSARHHGHPAYQWTDAQINQYQDAEVTIQYDHAPYARAEDAAIYASGTGELDRYVIRGETTPGAEALQLPGAVLNYIREAPDTYPPHTIKIPFNAARVLPQEKFVLTWHRVPEDVWDTTSTLYERVYTGDDVGGVTTPYFGAVNRQPFYGRDGGTVLLSGVRPVLKKSPLGSGFEWDIEYTFDFDPYGWNWKFYFGTGANAVYNGWYLVGKSTTHYFSDTLPDDYAIYNTRDLNKLFSVAA